MILNNTWVNDKPGLAFIGTKSYTNFRTLVRVLLYDDVVHVSSCSLVHVHWHERVVDAKCAPSAKHTASRTSWLHTCRESQDVPVNLP
jgi:hypothetical protein